MEEKTKSAGVIAGRKGTASPVSIETMQDTVVGIIESQQGHFSRNKHRTTCTVCSIVLGHKTSRIHVDACCITLKNTVIVTFCIGHEIRNRSRLVLVVVMILQNAVGWNTIKLCCRGCKR